VSLNHNAVRQHLAKLVDADLLVEEAVRRQGPGRPRLTYRPHPGTGGHWAAGDAYERLSLLLVDVVRSGDRPEEVGRRAGRRMRLRDSGAADPLGELVEVMSQQGFEPCLRERRGGFEIDLARCPFATVALAAPETVCALHLGLAQGVAERAGGLVVDELIPHDPRQAHCQLRVSRTPPGRVASRAAQASTEARTAPEGDQLSPSSS
jgi:predicted ArsR family transcriptional regulator